MTSDDEAKAQAIIDSWFWQMSESHSFRWSKAVKSMTLFYESAPMSSDIAQLVVEYLKTREGVTDFIINHKKWHFDAPGWNAKEASYVTAAGEKWNGTESTKVRIYWTLVQAGDGTADGPYTVENGCKYRVTHEYYWDVTSQPTLPQSTSGVQYSIQGFTRDKETGLFTYIVEKRETVEQSIPLYESAKTIFETVSEQQFLGVKQGSVAGKGLPASVGNGERVERHISKNPDCTSDITNRKVKDHKQEQSRVVTQKRLRGTSAAVTDRNLTPGEAAAKTAADQEVGETRTVEKTDTDLRNLTIEKTTPPTLPLTLAKSCEKEKSVHTDTTVELVQSSAADGSVEQTAEPNKRKTVSVKKNDDGKTADKTTVTQTWEEKTGGGSSNSGNGVVTTTTERKENTTSTPSATPGVNKVVEIEETPNDHGSKTTVMRVTTHSLQMASGGAAQGTAATTTTTRKQNATTEEPTGGAAVNQVIEVDNQPNGMGGFNSVKRTTTHTTKRATGTGSQGGVVSTTTERTQNGTSEVSGGSAAVNQVIEVDNQPNGMGGFNSVKRTTTHSLQMASGGAAQGTAATTTTTRKQNATTEEPTGGAAVNQVIEVDNQPNGMGGFNSVKRTTTHATKRASGTGSQGGVVSTTTERTQNGTSEVNAPTAGVNQVIEVDNQPNGMGGFNSVKRTTTYTEQQAIATSNFATERAVTTTTTHTTGQAKAACGTANAQPNDHGSKTTQVTEYTPFACDSGWIKWESVEESPSHTYTYECGIRVFKNLPQVPGAPGGARVQVSANINRYGLYDGSIAYSKLIRWAQGGNSGVYGGSQAGSIEFTYVSDYQISYPNDDVEITPVFATANVTTRAYYGYGNEGSEALARANSQALPGLHLAHRTYITSNTSSIVRAMKQAEAKLQAALANRKARGT